MDQAEPGMARRWYRIGPGSVLIVLLAMESMLLFFESRWNDSTSTRGWLVLLAFAVFGGAMLFLLIWRLACLLFRCRWRFGVRELLLLLVAAAVPCIWLGIELRAARNEREAVQTIESLGGLVLHTNRLTIEFDKFDSEGVMIGTRSRHDEPDWLRDWLGKEFFEEAAMVNFNFPHVPVTDTDVRYLARLRGLRYVVLRRTATDSTLELLVELPHLIGANLEGTQVTDAGLQAVRRMPNLQYLNVTRTHITDAGLEHLAGVRQLQAIELQGTLVSDAGVKKLQESLPTCRIKHGAAEPEFRGMPLGFWRSEAKAQDASRRKLAALALMQMGEGAKSALPVLLELLRDDDATTKRRAAMALEAIGPEAKGAIAALTELLRDPDEDVRQAAAEALKKIRPAKK